MRLWKALRGSTEPRVLDVQQTEVRLEGGDAFQSHGDIDRVAVLAHWSADGRVDRSTTELVRALGRNGYQVIVVSSATPPSALAWVQGRPESVTVIRRPNIGYDFGSWATAIDRFPSISDAANVVLINDSLVGPFRPIEHLIGQFERSAADVWGATDTTQFTHHLQSYCLGFRRGALRQAPLARFWREIRAETSRDTVIWQNEIGLSRLLERERFVTEAAFPYWRVIGEGKNPTILGWRGLLDLGFPFVKRQLLREPHVAPDAGDVPAEIERRFGVAISEWT